MTEDTYRKTKAKTNNRFKQIIIILHPYFALLQEVLLSGKDVFPYIFILIFQLLWRRGQNEQPMVLYVRVQNFVEYGHCFKIHILIFKNKLKTQLTISSHPSWKEKNSTEVVSIEKRFSACLFSISINLP